MAILVRRLGFGTLAAGVLLLLATRNASAEPEWWTKQKRDCRLPASLAYNDWDGKCGSSPTRSQPSQPTAAELAEQARQQRRRDALALNSQAIKFQKDEHWAKAIAFFEEAARLSPDDLIIRDNLSRAKAEAEQAANYAEYRKRQEPRERAARQQKKAAAERIHKYVQRLADSLSVPPDSTGAHARLGFVAGLGTTAPDAFGTRKAKPVIGVDPGSPEAASDQTRQGFDTSGSMKRTEPVRDAPAAKAVAADPRMIAVTRELEALRADGDRIDAEIDRLIQERNTTKDAAVAQTLTEKLEEKQRAKQNNLLQVYQTKEKTEKLRRAIEIEVAPSKQPSGSEKTQ